MTASDPTDSELVGRLARDGDPAAFDQLYRRHTATLFAVAVRRSQDASAAEDAVHDTWLRSVRGLRLFRGESAFRTWLVGILMNRLREQDRVREHETLDLVPEPPAAVSSPMVDADSIDLARAMATMPPRYQEVLILHDVEGFTHDEIGEMLAIDPGTSKSQLSRGRQWLRQQLIPAGKSDDRSQ